MACPTYCGLCRNQMTSGVLWIRINPCSHTFCRRCFMDYCDSKQTGSIMKIAAVPCPVCRQLVDVRNHCSIPEEYPSNHNRSYDDCDNSCVESQPEDLISPDAPAPTTSEIDRMMFVFPDVNVNNNFSDESPRDHQLAPNTQINDSQRFYNSKPHCRVDDKDNSVPTGLIFTTDSSVVVANYGKSLTQVINVDNAATTRNVTGLKPFSLGSHREGHVIVGDRKSQTVRIFDQNVEREVARWESGMFRWIGGVSGTRDGNVVVFDRECYQVGVYTDTGLLLRQFGAYGTGKSQTCMSDYLAADARGRVIVSDSANHCLKVFDSSNGEYLSQVGYGRGAHDGYLEWPRGVCVDEFDNLIVADHINRRICLFDGRSGRFIKHLLNDIANPSAVDYCKQNHLLAVTHFTLSGFSLCDIYRPK